MALMGRWGRGPGDVGGEGISEGERGPEGEGEGAGAGLAQATKQQQQQKRRPQLLQGKQQAAAPYQKVGGYNNISSGRQRIDAPGLLLHGKDGTESRVLISKADSGGYCRRRCWCPTPHKSS